ncbi:hypothetical protein TYRP_001957 [Tyrophagus putrescentiae]|nr:hypothetical protein TYRP_001957 [Tyrophagus putrescentiae]
MSDVSTKPPSKPSTSAEATPTVPLPPHVSTDDESSSLGVIVGVIVGGTVLIGAIILIYFFSAEVVRTG